MSRERANEQLQNYNGPVFPANIDELNDVFAGSNFGFGCLEEAGKKIRGFKGVQRCFTFSDKSTYTWFWGLLFEFGKAKLAVLFPWASYKKKAGGIRLDRSIAVYLAGPSDDLADLRLEELIEKIRLELLHIYKRGRN